MQPSPATLEKTPPQGKQRSGGTWLGDWSEGWIVALAPITATCAHPGHNHTTTLGALARSYEGHEA